MTSRWDFVFAAYAITALGTVFVLVHSWLGMRRAEQAARAMRDPRADEAVPPHETPSS